MRCSVTFTKEELELLKRPMDILLRNEEISKDTLSRYITSNLIISVGDATTDRLISFGIIPAIQIVDSKERRIPREAGGKYYNTEIRCTNPPGTITHDSIEVFKQALSCKKPVRIIVDGEEDLFGLVALALAPKGSIIFYGQPFEGIVILRVNVDNEVKFKNLLDKIKGNDDVAAG